MRPESVQLLEVLVLRSGDVGRIAAVIARLEGVEFESARVATPAPPPSASRPRTAAERAADYRARRAGVTNVTSRAVTDSVTSVTKNVTDRDERHVTNVTPFVTEPSLSSSPSPLSLSGNDSEKESESYSLVTRESVTASRDVTEPRHVTNAVTPVTNVTSRRTVTEAERYVALDDAILPEIVATAEMAGVQDIDGAWLKFCGHYAGKWLNVAGKWQLWCVNEAKRERVEREQRRDREAERAKKTAAPLTAEGLDPMSFEACQLRKKREKRADAERAEEILRAQGIKAGAR